MLVDWLERELAEIGVAVELGREVGIEDVRQADPEVVVVATGARGGYLWADQSEPTIGVFDIFSALARPDAQWGERVAILGGDHAACVVALHLRRLGVEVHIVEPSASVASDGEFNGLLVEMELDADPGVHVHRETTAELLTGELVAIQRLGKSRWLEVEAVVIGGRVSRKRLADELRQAGLRAIIYPIGDAVRARDLYTAGQEAAEVAEKVGLTSFRIR